MNLRGHFAKPSPDAAVRTVRGSAASGPHHRPYVLAWKLADRRVVVVGAGMIGTAKIETLLESGARIVAIDPTPTQRVEDLAERGMVRLKRRSFRPSDLAATALVIAATGSPKTNRFIRRSARVFGAVVNAVDDPPNCDVTVPAVIRRGPATIAITSGGATPAGARYLRESLTETIDAALPEGFGGLLREADEARRELRSRGGYRYDYYAWKHHLFEPGHDALARGTYRFGELRDRFLTSFRAHEPSPMGRVTLVGAGPGGADLITVRGARALAAADVVVYDRLADPELLALAPVAAERIPMGKAKGTGARQSAINAALIERARTGDHVVRLKGGDPFVFGRGSEEVAALVDAGIHVEVVPGVSSALAAPALAGIPLTDRSCASSFTVVSGHRADGTDLRVPAAASPATTLVVLMAASTADAMARLLLDLGWEPAAMAAFVHAAGTTRQASAVRRLDEVAEHGCPFGSPAVMVVGPTVEHAHLASVATHATVTPVLVD